VTDAGNVSLSIKTAPRTAKAVANSRARYPKTLGRIRELARIIPSGKNRAGAATMK
jgi:hypothetical protein